MTLHELFLNRIGYTHANEHNGLENGKTEIIIFEHLSRILELTSTTIPFENLRIMNRTTRDITRDHLIDTILVKREGGVCYELNPLFYLFLTDNGFQAALTRGVIYDNDQQQYLTLGRTHVTTLLNHQGEMYLVDAGVGGNLPLKPVPLNGETITSNNGQFRVKQVDHELGDYVFEIKLKHKDPDWRVNYIFDSKALLTDLAECTDVQQIIAEHEDSHFNKRPLINILTDRGSLTLTDRSFTKWEDGAVTKEKIDETTYSELLRTHFGLK